MSDLPAGLLTMVETFIRSVERDYPFPAGGAAPILTPPEADIYEWLQALDTTSAAVYHFIREVPDLSDGYTLAILGIRLAIFGVRNEDQTAYRQGLGMSLVSFSTIDWRDVLKSLAILEDCSERLALDFRCELSAALSSVVEPRSRSTIEAYITREPIMRSLAVMGLTTKGEGEQFTYENF